MFKSQFRMISRSLILQILQAAKIMRRFFYEAPAEIMRNYTTICGPRNTLFLLMWPLKGFEFEIPDIQNIFPRFQNTVFNSNSNSTNFKQVIQLISKNILASRKFLIFLILKIFKLRQFKYQMTFLAYVTFFWHCPVPGRACPHSSPQELFELSLG